MEKDIGNKIFYVVENLENFTIDSILKYLGVNDLLNLSDTNDYSLKIKKTNLVNTYLINRRGKLPKVELINKNTNKAKSIKYIEKVENPYKIEVIGDGLQDIEMIQEYKGNCMTNAVEEVKQISKKQYKYVYELIQELQSNE